MKYFLAFLSFWKKFVLGDDRRIAITVMWSFLFIFSLTQEFYNIWFLLPFIIIGMMTTLLILQQNSRSKLLHFSSPGNRLYFLELPMAMCLIIPIASFRLHAGDFTTEYLLGPTAISLAIVFIYSFVTKNLFQRFPSLVSFFAGIITYLLVTVFMATMNIFSQHLTQSFQTLYEATAWIWVIVYIIRSVRIMLDDFVN